MKKIIIIFAAVLTSGIISCKKQYSCQCSTTFSSPNYSPYTVSSVENIDKKTTKKRATQICSHAEKQMADNAENYTSGTVSTSCAIK